MNKFTNWVRNRFSADGQAQPVDLRKSGALPAARRRSPATVKPESDHVDFAGPTKDSDAPGSHPPTRNKYVREDTGTHETLKIIDDSVVESGEEAGIDPYNTGSFDRSKNWNNRLRK